MLGSLIKRAVFVFTAIFNFILCQQDKGQIFGSVIDRLSEYPLQGANISISGSDLGTVTDEDGRFYLDNIDQGYYTLVVSFIGFETVTLPDIWVRPKAYDLITVRMNHKIIQLDGVIVEDSYFVGSDLNQEQSIIFRNDEIRRAPGAAQELSRILNSLPSVASVGENRQDLMVRGGGPTENGFIVDNIHLPNITHFGMEDGRSNGPIGMINTELIDNIEFYSNGFPAKYGGRLSSFGEINYRDGNQNAIEGNLSMGIGGAGLMLEGPLGEKSTFISSYRRSYLDVIAAFINAGGLPSYDDLQAKITYKPDHYNILTFLTVNGSSLYQRKEDNAIEDGLSQFGQRKNKQNTFGFNYKRIWNKKSFSNTSISYTQQITDAKFIEIDDGSVSSSIKNSLYTVYLRNTNQIKINNLSSLEFGYESRLKKADYDFFLNGLSISQNIQIENNYSFFTLKQILSERFFLSGGFRLSQSSFEAESLLSPRLSLKYSLNDNSKLIYSLGKYFQNPHEIYLSIDSNDRLTSAFALQSSLTYERLLSTSSKFSFSIYKKLYGKAPSYDASIDDKDDLSFLMDKFRMNGNLISSGNASAEGVEFLLEKKRAENFYGHIGATFFNATFTDLNGDIRNRDYNYRYIFNIVGGFRPKDKWEISIRWSMFGGKPYTPINIELSNESQYEVLIEDRNNEYRTPVYHSLFIRYDYRKNYNFGNLIGYMELWNAYNRENIEGYYWDGDIRKETYFNLIPVVGIEMEF